MGHASSTAIMGECKRQGVWSVPANHSALALMGSVVIDLTPTPVKEAVIARVGTADKPILLAVVSLGTLLLAAVAGLLSRRRPSLGIVVQAGHDLTVQGSAVVAEGDVTLTAVNDVRIGAATSTSSRKASSKVVEQGFLDSDAVVSYGERTTTTRIDESGSTQSGQERSLVGSGRGNVSVTAGRALNVTGSDLAAGPLSHASRACTAPASVAAAPAAPTYVV